MSKKIIITAIDDEATKSCDITIEMSPSMDIKTFYSMKKALETSLKRLLKNGWAELKEPTHNTTD